MIVDKKKKEQQGVIRYLGDFDGMYGPHRTYIGLKLDEPGMRILYFQLLVSEVGHPNISALSGFRLYHLDVY